MLKKVLLFLITAILVLTVSVGVVYADPANNQNNIVEGSSSEGSSDNSLENILPGGPLASTEESSDPVESPDQNESTEESSSTASKTESKTESKFYIKDDSDFYTESLGALGGNASTVVSTVDISSDATADTSSVVSTPNKNLAGVEKFAKYIWIPIGLIALCVLVLVCFNRIYKVKYESIDPRAKKTHKDAPKNTTHRPRD